MTTIDRQMQNTLYTWLCHQQRAQTQLPDAVDLAVQPHDPAMAPAIAGAIRELAAMPGVQVRGSIKLNLEVDFGDTQ